MSADDMILCIENPEESAKWSIKTRSPPFRALPDKEGGSGAECVRAGIVRKGFSEQEIFRLGPRGVRRHLSGRLQGGRLGWGQWWHFRPRRHARRRRYDAAEAIVSCECD